MPKTRRELKLTKTAMETGLASLPSDRERKNFAKAYIDDARNHLSKKEGSAVYGDLAEIFKEKYKDYRFAGIAYDLAGKRGDASKMFAKSAMERAGLVRKIAVVSVIFGIFLLAPNITGGVIGNLSKNTSNYTGIILFLLGIIGYYFCSQK